MPLLEEMRQPYWNNISKTILKINLKSTTVAGLTNFYFKTLKIKQSMQPSIPNLRSITPISNWVQNMWHLKTQSASHQPTTSLEKMTLMEQNSTKQSAKFSRSSSLTAPSKNFLKNTLAVITPNRRLLWIINFFGSACW